MNKLEPPAVLVGVLVLNEVVLLPIKLLLLLLPRPTLYDFTFLNSSSLDFCDSFDAWIDAIDVFLLLLPLLL